MVPAKFTLRAPFSLTPRVADAEGALLAPNVCPVQTDGGSAENASAPERPVILAVLGGGH